MSLNQLEWGRFTWDDADQKLKFRRALVWHPATSTMSAAVSFSAGSCKRFLNQGKSYNVIARLGTKDCESFNSGTCFTGASHPERQHICSYCLSTINSAFPHSPKHLENLMQMGPVFKLARNHFHNSISKITPMSSGFAATNPMASSQKLWPPSLVQTSVTITHNSANTL